MIVCFMGVDFGNILNGSAKIPSSVGSEAKPIRYWKLGMTSDFDRRKAQWDNECPCAHKQQLPPIRITRRRRAGPKDIVLIVNELILKSLYFAVIGTGRGESSFDHSFCGLQYRCFSNHTTLTPPTCPDIPTLTTILTSKCLDLSDVQTFGCLDLNDVSTSVMSRHLNVSMSGRATGEDTIEVPEASDEVPSVGTVAVTQGGTRKGYTVLGSVMGLQQSFRQRSLHAIWVSLRSAKKKEVPERRTEPID
ncbi:hypothetical protein DFH05DRAFT_1559863 [Lentinula detonsa]|uniref:Uncharacterized protein n=1 Tax=Lentinula detonsa TaxID=2804962 RepID=A0A9W8NSX3_9AGAR|nr:hypothetical protein DFH05DRAFT_1559863 [Lentinula detonsa]